MNRSNEIIKLLKLPKEITKYILEIERNNILKKSYEEWINIKYFFFNKFNQKKYNYKFYKYMLFRDIRDIQGNFTNLKDHKNKFKALLKEVYHEHGFINNKFKNLKY